MSETVREIDTLKRLAGRYIWWKTPDDAAAMPARVIAQVMNLGDYEDVQILAKHVGDAALRDGSFSYYPVAVAWGAAFSS